jgi:hypothetical protein
MKLHVILEYLKKEVYDVNCVMKSFFEIAIEVRTFSPFWLADVNFSATRAIFAP